MPIFGRDNEQIFHRSDDLPEEYGTGWYIMLDRKPRIFNRVYEAQPDGTWLDVTTTDQEIDNTNKATLIQKYDIIMSVLEDLPISPAITFMLMYDELIEYQQHGTQGELLTNVVQTSGMTPAQVVYYLATFFIDIKTTLGKLIGRRIG